MNLQKTCQEFYPKKQTTSEILKCTRRLFAGFILGSMKTAALYDFIHLEYILHQAATSHYSNWLDDDPIRTAR
jgi:hypothetical protein